jgi:hypothetical protein
LYGPLILAINLPNLCLIPPRLEEHPQLLKRILGKTTREVEEVVASFGGPARAATTATHAAHPLIARLEIDHIRPWGLGGPSDNQSEAIRVFGRG